MSSMEKLDIVSEFVNEGITSLDTANQKISIKDSQFSSFTTAQIEAIVRDNVLFNHGLYFSKGCLQVDPLRDVTKTNQDEIKTFQFANPVFEGINLGYDSILFACAKTEWPKYYIYLKTVSGFNAQEKHYWEGFAQKVPISYLLDSITMPDEFFYVFGVSSNKGLYAFFPTVGINSTVKMRIVKYPPETNVVETSAKFL